jgi:hypothetical protein
MNMTIIPKWNMVNNMSATNAKKRQKVSMICTRDMPAMQKHAAHGMDKPSEHAQHTDHSGHEDMFRKRFWVSLLLSIPVLLYTPMLQMWFWVHDA